MYSTSKACSHPRSEHRVNWPAVNGVTDKAGVLPRARRIFDVLALTTGGEAVKLHAGVLGRRTHASRRTVYRAFNDLQAAGLVEWFRQYRVSERTGRPKRETAVVRLSPMACFAAYGGVPKRATIHGRARARQVLSLASALTGADLRQCHRGATTSQASTKLTTSGGRSERYTPEDIERRRRCGIGPPVEGHQEDCHCSACFVSRWGPDGPPF